jgi:hypothetical protein
MTAAERRRQQALARALARWNEPSARPTGPIHVIWSPPGPSLCEKAEARVRMALPDEWRFVAATRAHRSTRREERSLPRPRRAPRMRRRRPRVRTGSSSSRGDPPGDGEPAPPRLCGRAGVAR